MSPETEVYAGLSALKEAWADAKGALRLIGLDQWQDYVTICLVFGMVALSLQVFRHFYYKKPEHSWNKFGITLEYAPRIFWFAGVVLVLVIYFFRLAGIQVSNEILPDKYMGWLKYAIMLCLGVSAIQLIWTEIALGFHKIWIEFQAQLVPRDRID